MLDSIVSCAFENPSGQTYTRGKSLGTRAIPRDRVTVFHSLERSIVVQAPQAKILEMSASCFLQTLFRDTSFIVFIQFISSLSGPSSRNPSGQADFLKNPSGQRDSPEGIPRDKDTMVCWAFSRICWCIRRRFRPALDANCHHLRHFD